MNRALTTLFSPLLALALLAAPFCLPAAAQEAASLPAPEAPNPAFGKPLVIVFSGTGNTLRLAELIVSRTGADLYRIEPAEPFPASEADIILLEEGRRGEGRPAEIKGTPPDLAPYSLIFLGSPVWFGVIPDHVSVFLASLDFTGKKVALFASAGTRPGDIIENLTSSVKGGTVLGPALIRKRADDWSEQGLAAAVNAYLADLTDSLAETEAPLAEVSTSPASAK
ncbi:MAG: hypothetical protein LBG06_07715 [Deltaproteobacteria bacterium]|jgi:flavodoxin|nr:hypothetical protein [Deltaproteobacteria bacterium]